MWRLDVPLQGCHAGEGGLHGDLRLLAGDRTGVLQKTPASGAHFAESAPAFCAADVDVLLVFKFKTHYFAKLCMKNC